MARRSPMRVQCDAATRMGASDAVGTVSGLPKAGLVHGYGGRCVGLLYARAVGPEGEKQRVDSPNWIMFQFAAFATPAGSQVDARLCGISCRVAAALGLALE